MNQHNKYFLNVCKKIILSYSYYVQLFLKKISTNNQHDMWLQFNSWIDKNNIL